MKPSGLLLALLSLGAAAGTTQAQTPLLPPLPPDISVVHLDTPASSAPGTFTAYGEFRAFGGDEDLVYTGLGAQYGFGSGWSGLIRGTASGRKNFALSDDTDPIFTTDSFLARTTGRSRQAGEAGSLAIRHGGSELELVAKYRSPQTDRLAGLIGISFPDTTAQNDPILTLGVAAAAPVAPGVTIYANPRAAFIKDNFLLGLGLGVRARLSDSIALVADVTPIITGDNTRSTDDGDNGRREKRAVYGIGLRIAPARSPLTYELGFANGTGRTTGSALTPGLGGAGAFYAGLSFRR